MVEPNAERDEKKLNSQGAAEPESVEEVSASHERFNLIGRLVWSLILVWVGGVLLTENLGYLDRLALPPVELPWAMPVQSTVWRLIFLGAGALLALGVVARFLFPAYREDILGNLILVIVCFALSFGQIDLVWPLILIAVGVALLLRFRT